MKYTEVELSKIKPYDRNPREIPEDAIDAVAKSISAFGFRSPIIVDRDGVILAGHTRYLASRKLGLKTVPVIQCNDMNDIQARGYRIADNKVAELSKWDKYGLDAEVRALAEMSSDLDALGFSESELNRILSDCGSSAQTALEALEKELINGRSGVSSASGGPAGGAVENLKPKAPSDVSGPPKEKLRRFVITAPEGPSEVLREELEKLVQKYPGVKIEAF